MSQTQIFAPDLHVVQKRTIPIRPERQMERLSPRWRQLLLAMHIVVSVAVIGADISVIALAATGLISGVPEMIRAGYLMMELLVKSVLLPLALTALVTGILLGLVTSWGLRRYYWVLTKLVLTISAVTALVFVLRPRVTQAAAEVLKVPLAELTTTGIGKLGVALTVGPMVALLVLIAIAILAVYKPWGQTRFGRH